MGLKFSLVTLLLGLLTLTSTQGLAAQYRRHSIRSPHVYSYAPRHYSARSYTRRVYATRHRTAYSRPAVRHRTPSYRHSAARPIRARVHRPWHTRRPGYARVAHRRHVAYAAPGTRDARGRLRRSREARASFMRSTGYPQEGQDTLSTISCPWPAGGHTLPQICSGKLLKLLALRIELNGAGAIDNPAHPTMTLSVRSLLDW